MKAATDARTSRRQRLNNTVVRKLGPELKKGKPAPYEVRDTSTKNFWVRVSAKGSKSYYTGYRVKRTGPLIQHSLGDVGKYDNVEIARKLAAKIQFEAETEGRDPKALKLAASKARKTATATPTLGKYLDGEYETHLLDVRRNELTAYNALNRLKSAFSDFQKLKLTTINKNGILEWQRKRLKAGRTSTTVSRDLAELRSCLNRAMKQEYITLNPFFEMDGDDRKPLKSKGEEGKRVRYLGQRDEHENIKDKKGHKLGEQQRLLSALESYELPAHTKPIVLVALHTGLRRKELLTLCWRDVSFARQTINVLNTKNGEPRHAYLNEVTNNALQKWKEDQGNVVHLNGLIFPGPTNQPMMDIRRSWLHLLKLAQISDFRFHDLRHDFASQLVMKGVDLNTVRELMGHADIKMTLRYAHLAPKHKVNAVSLLVD